MAIDHFTREQFEAALPCQDPNKYRTAENRVGTAIWVPGDWSSYMGGNPPTGPHVPEKGEYVYSMLVDRANAKYMFVIIRSSVRQDGVSADSGKDSIRLYLMHNGRPVAGKLTKYITRVKGWEKRMTTQLRTLYKIGLSLKPCPTCGELRHAFTAGKGKDSMAKPENVGRLFQKCCRVDARGKGQHGCERSFEWIEFKEDKDK